MSETADIWLCNAADDPMTIWLEPWAQEFVLPHRGELLLRCPSHGDAAAWPEIDANESLLTVWGAGASRIAVFIDGNDQDSFSAEHSSPDMGALTPRRFVEIAFGRHPEATGWSAVAG